MNTLLDFLNNDELVMFTEILRQQILNHCDIEIQQLEKGNIQDINKKLNLLKMRKVAVTVKVI